METQKPKIAFYVKRSFGEKFNASFDFIKENWRLLLKFTTYLLLPLCLIQALSLNGFAGGIVNPEYSSTMAILSYYGLYIVLYMIGSVVLTSLIYAMMRMYNDREGRLQGVTLGMLRRPLFRNIKRIILVILLSFFLMMVVSFVMGMIRMIFPLTLFLMIPLFIIVMIPFSLWAVILLFEDISIVNALKKAYRLGFATWGGILAILVIMGIVGGILQGVTMIPWYIGLLAKALFAATGTGSEFTVSAGYNFMLYLLAVIQTFGAYLSFIFILVGLAYQYGHASEKEDNVTVESDIDNFDKL